MAQLSGLAGLSSARYGRALPDSRAGTIVAKRWRDNKDTAALEDLTRAHMRLVIAIAARFRNYGLPVPDLVRKGMWVCWKQRRGSNPSGKCGFSTYATW